MRSFLVTGRAVIALAITVSAPLTASHAAVTRAATAVPAATPAAKARNSTGYASPWRLYVLAAAVLAAIAVAVASSSGDDKDEAVSRG